MGGAVAEVIVTRDALRGLTTHRGRTHQVILGVQALSWQDGEQTVLGPVAHSSVHHPA